jgi:hypothetical protein
MTKKLSPTSSMKKRMSIALATQVSEGRSQAAVFLADAIPDLALLRRFDADDSFPMKCLIEEAIKILLDRKARKTEARALQAAESHLNHMAQVNAEKQRIDSLEASLSSAKSPDQRLRILVALSPEDRKKYGSKEEQKACIEFRKSCLLTSKAQEFIGATPTEFSRWVEEGLIAPAYFKSISVGKMISARCWALCDLVALQEKIPYLRDSWSARKKAKRTKLKVVASKQAS